MALLALPVIDPQVVPHPCEYVVLGDLEHKHEVGAAARSDVALIPMPVGGTFLFAAIDLRPPRQAQGRVKCRAKCG